jgi:hypothetical protein
MRTMRGAAVGLRADHEAQARQVGDGVALLRVQADLDVVRLVVARAPLAHGLAGDQAAQRGRDRADRQAGIGCRVAPHLHAEHRLAGLERGVQVDQARDALQLRAQCGGDALQFLQVAALDGQRDRLVAAHGVQQAHVRDHDARHRGQALAQGHRELVDAARAVLAVDQPHVDAGLVAALRVPGIDGRQRVPDLGHLAQDAVDLPRAVLGDLDRRADGRVEVDRGLGEVGLGHELRAHQRHQGHAGGQGAGGDAQRRKFVLERPAQHGDVELAQVVLRAVDPMGHAAQRVVVQAPGHEGLAFAVDRRVVPDRAEHRVEREADEHRDHHRGHDGDAELVEELADDAAHEADGQEDRHDRQRGGQHRQADLVGAVHRRVVGGFAHLHVAHDVLAHDDGVVDQQAHAQAQCHQRDHVDREAEQLHEQEGAHQRDRQRQAGDDGRAPGIQEQEDDADRQHGALDQRALDVGHRHTDGPRVVAHDVQRHAAGKICAQARGSGVQAVDDLDGVLALALLHVQAQRAPAVQQREGLDLLGAVDHVGHLPQPHRLQVRAAARDDDLAQFLGPLHGGIDLHHPFALARAQRAGRQLAVLGAQGAHDLFDRHAQRFHRRGLEVDVDLALARADHRHRADPLDILEPLLGHLVGVGAQLDRRARAVGRGQRQRVDRPCGGVEALHTRFLDLGAEQRPHQGQLLAHVVGGLAAVDVEVELHHDQRHALVAAREDLVDAGHGVGRFLDLAGDLDLHHLG